MADPIKYEPEYNFNGYQASNPSRPLPAPQLDNELANIASSISESVDAIKSVRRSDGALNNAIVTPDSLSDDTRSLLTRLGDVSLATEDQAEAGTDNETFMSPLRSQQAFRRRLRSFTPADYAADAGADITPAERTVRLQAMIDGAASAGYSVIVPKAETFYETASYLRLNGRNARVYLDGDIYNTQIDAADGGIRQRALGLGNYHPIYLDEAAGGLDWYLVDTFTRGAATVALSAGVNRTDGLAAFTAAGIGAPVIFRSRQYYVGSAAANAHAPDFVVLAHVAAITATGVTLDRPICEVPADSIIALANSTSPDIEGNPLFVADGVKVFGEGSIRSMYGAALLRTGLLDCTIDLASVVSDAGSAMGFNLLGGSQVRVDSVRGATRLVEIACSSHESAVEIGSGEYTGPGGSVPAVSVGENSRQISLKMDWLNGGLFSANSGFIRIANGRKITIDIAGGVAPSVTGPAILVESGAQPVSGFAVQPKTHDNVLKFGPFDFGAGLSRFVYGTDAGGENKRNRVESGQFKGSVSANAVRFDGTDNYLGSIWCEDGSLNVAASTNLTVEGGYYPDGVVFSSGTMADHNVIGVTSDAQALLRQSAVTQNVAATSSDTTPNAIFASKTIAAGSFSAGDTLEIEVAGQTTGTAGAKTLQIMDDAGALCTLSLLAAATGPFRLTVKISLVSEAHYIAFGETAGALTRTRRTGLSLGSSSRTFSVERWVADAADSITVDYYAVKPVRKGYTGLGG